MSDDRSLIDDDVPVAVTRRGLTYPFGDAVPVSGAVRAIVPGVEWVRLPVPGGLDHINVWLLEDTDDRGNGVAIVDTGLYLPPTTDAWPTVLGGRRVTRIICTHFHPDHTGCAGWLAREHDVPLYMTRAEFLMLRLAIADTAPEPPSAVIAHARRAGWDEAQLEAMRSEGWGRMARIVSPPPTGFRRLRDGDTLRIGDADWSVVVGNGHSPEHACLVDARRGLMIAGDQVLPRITSNVSVGAMEPDADPLGDWLASIARFRRDLSDDLLVLPAHGLPFRGLHARLDQLAEGHRKSLDRLHDRLREGERRVVDTFPALFPRPVGDHFGLATGEALAHLKRLEVEARAMRTLRDGVWYFAAA